MNIALKNGQHFVKYSVYVSLLRAKHKGFKVEDAKKDLRLYISKKKKSMPLAQSHIKRLTVPPVGQKL